MDLPLQREANKMLEGCNWPAKYFTCCCEGLSAVQSHCTHRCTLSILSRSSFNSSLWYGLVDVATNKSTCPQRTLNKDFSLSMRHSHKSRQLYSISLCLFSCWISSLPLTVLSKRHLAKPQRDLVGCSPWFTNNMTSLRTESPSALIVTKT